MKEENYGQLIADSGCLTQYNESFPLIHYIDGIREFDDQLGSKIFSETNFCHGMMFYENAVVFMIFNDEAVVKFARPKINLIEVKVLKTTKIKIRNVNKISKSLKSGVIGGAGIAGALLTTAIGSVSDKLTDKFKGITSKEVDGTTFELIFKNEDESTSIVRVGCESQYNNQVALFLNKRLLTKPEDASSSSSCYIATVCYGNNMAPEVIKFREFRDVFLKNYSIGRQFIRLYYNNAESLSIKLSRRPLVNALIKNLVLNPIYLVIRIFYR